MPGTAGEATSRAATVLGVLLLIALAVGVVALAVAMLPSHVTPERSPSSLNLVVADRWVIWLLRLSGLVLLVLFLVFAVYVARSLLHRMRRGHWLQSGGPFQAEIVDRAGDALADVEPLFDALTQAEQRNTELEEQLAESSRLIEQLANMIERAVAAGFEILPEGDET